MRVKLGLCPARASSLNWGKLFQIFTIPSEELLSFPENSPDFSSLVVPTNVWQFLVLNNGQARAILTVDWMNNQWAAVAIGASGLAAQLGKIIEAYPPAQGYTDRFVRLFRAKSDFMEISQQGTVLGIIPFISARVAMRLDRQGFDVSDLRPFRETVLNMKLLVRGNRNNKK